MRCEDDEMDRTIKSVNDTSMVCVRKLCLVKRLFFKSRKYVVYTIQWSLRYTKKSSASSHRPVLRPGLFPDQRLVDVGDDAAASDRRLDQAVQFLNGRSRGEEGRGKAEEIHGEGAEGGAEGAE